MGALMPGFTMGATLGGKDVTADLERCIAKRDASRKGLDPATAANPQHAREVAEIMRVMEDITAPKQPPKAPYGSMRNVDLEDALRAFANAPPSISGVVDFAGLASEYLRTLGIGHMRK